MIITKTPFRISLCGGGSDLPAYYKKNGGAVISTTINKYMYITSHPSFDKDVTTLKYSKIEKVKNIDDIKHPIFKECLKYENIEGLEITSIADVPQNTGLGSSSSFTVGLLYNLKSHKKEVISKEDLANLACEMEINKVGSPIGKQDQYAASYGGFNFYEFKKDGSVKVEPVIISKKALKDLERNLILLYVGGEHDSSIILTEQSKNITETDKEKGQMRIVELTYELKEELKKDNIDFVGEALHENWLIKQTLASGITNKKFDDLYEKALKNGATGGKILGAGGRGFFLFYVPLKKQKDFLKKMELPEMKFKFESSGSTVIYVN